MYRSEHPHSGRGTARAAALVAVLALVGLLLACSGGGGDDTKVTPPSSLTYPKLFISGVVGTAITPDTATVTGSVDSYSISPALPTGLSLDAKTGTISGTPTATGGLVQYTITATNAAGSATTPFGTAVFATQGATIAGTIALPASVTDKLYAVIVDTDHEGGNGGQVAWTVGKGTGSSFDYVIENAPAGSYMVYAIVWVASTTIGPPTTGDYATGDFTTYTISGTSTYTVNQTAGVL